MRRRCVMWVRRGIRGWIIVVPVLALASLGALVAGSFGDVWWRGGLGAFGAVWLVFGSLARAYKEQIQEWRPRVPWVAVGWIVRIGHGTPVWLWQDRVGGQDMTQASLDFRLDGHTPVAMTGVVRVPAGGDDVDRVVGLMWAVAPCGSQAIDCHLGTNGRARLTGDVDPHDWHGEVAAPLLPDVWLRVGAHMELGETPRVVFLVEGQRVAAAHLPRPVPDVARVRTWAHRAAAMAELRDFQILFVPKWCCSVEPSG